MGGTLALLVLAVTVAVFRPAVATWTRTQKQSRAQQLVLVAARHLRTDVEKAAPGSFVVEGGRLFMAGPGHPVTFDTAGQTVWTEVVSYYLDEEGQLRRQVDPLTAGTEPDSIPRPPIQPDARIVARDMTVFEITVERTWLVKYRLVAEREGEASSLESAASSRLAPVDLRAEELQD